MIDVVEEKVGRRTGKELVKYSFRFAVEDRRKSWLFTLSTLVMMLGALAGTVFMPHWSLKLGMSILAALFMVRFFIIYHDYMHKAILQDSFLAKAIMSVYGMFILAPTTIWRRTHDHHHQNNSKLSNSGIGSFPLLSREGYERLNKQQRLKYLVSRHYLTIVLGYLTLFVLDFNVGSILKNPRLHWDSILALVLHIGLWVGMYLLGGWLAVLFTVVIPFVLSHALGSYLFYAQHNFPEASFRENKDWDYVYAALNSTSFLEMNPLMNWFTGNIGYHHVHHVNHKIPFYRLKEAMEDMPELHHPKRTTLKISDIISCLRLQVWDNEKGRMMPI